MTLIIRFGEWQGVRRIRYKHCTITHAGWLSIMYAPIDDDIYLNVCAGALDEIINRFYKEEKE